MTVRQRISWPVHSRVAPSRRWLVALVLWVAALIATPIAGWVGGEGTFPAMATLTVMAQAAATLLALADAWPPRRTLACAVVIAAGAWAAEVLGTRTGLPFGAYSYTAALQPQLLHVPLLIPLAWLMMLPPAWAVAARLAPEQSLRFAAIGGLAFTAWDLYLDPQMVSRGLWLWDAPGGYFGIPWGNFVGWWMVATLLTLLVRPREIPVRPLMTIYILTWLFQAVGLGILWGQPGPALAGFFGMGIFAGLAWRGRSR